MQLCGLKAAGQTLLITRQNVLMFAMFILYWYHFFNLSLKAFVCYVYNVYKNNNTNVVNLWRTVGLDVCSVADALAV